MNSRKKAMIKWLITLSLAVSAGFALTLSGIYLYLSPSLPEVDKLRDVRLQTPLRVYSQDGKLIGQFGEKRRTPVDYDDIPKTYIDALLAAEDASFFEHKGVSIKALIRASSQLLMSGNIQTGGSTITMQVARNYFLTKKQTFRRKFKEILLALKIERELSKEDILERYVNVIFLGNRAYGIQAAAQVYYGKPLDQLSLAQLAMLAGLPQAPSTKNPIINPNKALERRNWILKRMFTLEKISQQAYKSATNEALSAIYHGAEYQLSAPYIAEMARKKAVDLFGDGAYTDGYVVYTSIESQLQLQARDAVSRGVEQYDKRHGFREIETSLLYKNEKAEGPISWERLDEWKEKLAEIEAFNDLIPAAVVHAEGKLAKVMTAKGEIIELSWETDFKETKPYISESITGKKPKAVTDLIAIGDVVRIKPKITKSNTASWQLTQIPKAQATLVALNANDGSILALVGGTDFSQSEFNRAIQAKRQPGSNFKPFIYTTALENGMTPASVINDAPIVFEDDRLESTWRPENSSGKFYGPTRLRKALYLSRNLVSIRVLRQIGINTTLKSLARFGFTQSELPRDLSLALGSHALPPLDIASAYASFANGGFKVSPYIIKHISDASGRIVYQANPKTACKNCNENLSESYSLNNQPFTFDGDPFGLSAISKILLGVQEPEDMPRAERIIDERIVYTVDSMLRDVINRGTATKAKSLKRTDIAGKTGTTNGPTDAWFSGYGGHIVTTTWLGFDDNSPLGKREFGGTAALPIWIDFMKEALKNVEPTPRTLPAGLVSVRINAETGLRARIGEPNSIFEIFLADQVPDYGEVNTDLNTPFETQAEQDTGSVTETLF